MANGVNAANNHTNVFYACNAMWKVINTRLIPCKCRKEFRRCSSPPSPSPLPRPGAGLRPLPGSSERLALQTRIAARTFDGFLIFCACHREMGPSDLCHPHGGSQPASQSPSQSTAVAASPSRPASPLPSSSAHTPGVMSHCLQAAASAQESWTANTAGREELKVFRDAGQDINVMICCLCVYCFILTVQFPIGFILALLPVFVFHTFLVEP